MNLHEASRQERPTWQHAQRSTRSPIGCPSPVPAVSQLVWFALSFLQKLYKPVLATTKDIIKRIVPFARFPLHMLTASGEMKSQFPAPASIPRKPSRDLGFTHLKFDERHFDFSSWCSQLTWTFGTSNQYRPPW